jgi:hypothetical protein
MCLEISEVLLGREIGPSQGLYLHMTAQHIKARIYNDASSWIRTQDLSVRVIQDIRTLNCKF